MLTLLASPYARGSLAVLAILAALWGYGAWQYEAGYDDAERARAMADLVAQVEESHRLSIIANELERQVEELRQAQPKIIERYNNVIIEKPLHIDCRIDTDRMQHITSAIEAANSSQSSGAVRAD